MVFVPDGRDEPLAAGVADGDVGEEPVPVVAHQCVGQARPEGVVWSRGEDVVAQGAAAGLGDPGRVVEGWGEVGFTALWGGEKLVGEIIGEG